MKRLMLIALGALLLAACGQSNVSSTGGSSRPELPSGVEVRFPAAPASAMLSLQTEAGDTVYQVTVAQGKTSVDVDPSKWAAQSANAVALDTLLPPGSTMTVAGTKVVFLHWVMWKDANQNGRQDAGEALDLMTHDRVAYASQAVTAEFTQNSVHQIWRLSQGWSRAAHYVYLPTGSSVYERRLESDGVQRYELHVPTPVTSQ